MPHLRREIKRFEMAESVESGEGLELTDGTAVPQDEIDCFTHFQIS